MYIRNAVTRGGMNEEGSLPRMENLICRKENASYVRRSEKYAFNGSGVSRCGGMMFWRS